MEKKIDDGPPTKKSRNLNPKTMKVEDLKNELASRGLDCSGQKTELCQRLQEALEKEDGKVAAPRLDEWFITKDSSSMDGGRRTEKTLYTGIVSGLSTKPDGSLFTTSAVLEENEHAIVCTTGERFYLGPPSGGEIITKVVDMLGPWGNQMDGGQGVNLQVAKEVRPVAIDIRSKFLEGMNGERQDPLSTAMQIYQVLLLGNALACRSTMIEGMVENRNAEAIKGMEKTIQKHIKDETLDAFCGEWGIPPSLVKKMEELNSAYDTLTTLNREVHQILYSRDTAHELAACVREGGLAKAIDDRKSRFLGCCEARAAKCREQHKVRQQEAIAATTAAAKAELAKREALEKCALLESQLLTANRLVKSLKDRQAQLTSRLEAIQAELTVANSDMETALKSRGVIPLGPLAAVCDSLIDSKQSCWIDVQAADDQLKDEERRVKDLNTELTKAKKSAGAAGGGAAAAPAPGDALKAKKTAGGGSAAAGAASAGGGGAAATGGAAVSAKTKKAAGGGGGAAAGGGVKK